MHDHNENNGHKGMMWMMIPCILLVVIALFGGSKLASSNYLWLIILGVCVVPHIWMMLKRRGKHEDKDENDKSKHGGCCH
mgnify:CR=1 FL=1